MCIIHEICIEVLYVYYTTHSCSANCMRVAQCVHYALQHTATHCNTLQHTATCFNTLQHTATRCDMLRHAATCCNTHFFFCLFLYAHRIFLYTCVLRARECTSSVCIIHENIYVKLYIEYACNLIFPSYMHGSVHLHILYSYLICISLYTCVLLCKYIK